MSPASRSLRWWLCGLLFIATALSFMDRQVLSVLAPQITEQLRMSNTDYSDVTNAFLLSYAVMFLFGGWLLDLVGTRWGMTVCVGFWSIASAAHAAAHNAWHLGACRFFLGVGEGGCFPGAAKGVAEWFPARLRALATGVAIGGASLGAVVAPPLTIWVAKLTGWRGVFLVTGGLGAAWVVAWWWLTRFQPSPEDDEVPVAVASPAGGAALPIASLLARLDVWGFAIVRFIVDPVFYFYMFWIPKYLAQERGASMVQIGQWTWIPFLALGISNVLGGWASDGLIRGGWPMFHARRFVMALAALLTLSSSLAGHVASVAAALAMMALLMLAHGFWITNYVTLISDRFPKGAVGTVMGFSGAVGALGGMFANRAIGWTVDHFSYGPIWILSGLMYPLAFLVVLATIGPGHSLPPQQPNRNPPQQQNRDEPAPSHSSS